MKPPTSMTGGQRWTAAGIAAGVTAAGGLGLALSYETVRAVAADYGLPFPDAYPLGLEGGLVAILALDLLLTWRRTPIGWLRQVARLLAGSTIVINAAAGLIGTPEQPGTLFAALLHALPPLLFVVIVEAARHVLLRLVAAEDVWRRDPIPRMRWLLAPLPTLVLWRRMVLWQIASYEQALDADLDRREIISSLKREFGRRWHREVPADLAYRIRAGVRMDGAIQAARALLADRRGLVLDAAGTVPALPDPDDDGPGNGDQEPVEPWLDDVEFARLVAGLELPSVPEEQEQERERGTGSRSGMGAGNGEPSREQEPLLENEERGTGNGERGPEPFRNEEQERGTGNGEPLLSDGEPVPQERERGTGNGLRAVPDSEEQGTGNEEPRSPRPRRNRSGNGSGTGNGQRRNVRGVPDTEVAAEVVDLVGRGELTADVPVRDLTARYVMGNGRACRVRSLVLELLASERSEAVFPAA